MHFLWENEFKSESKPRVRISPEDNYKKYEHIFGPQENSTAILHFISMTVVYFEQQTNALHAFMVKIIFFNI